MLFNVKNPKKVAQICMYDIVAQNDQRNNTFV